MSAATSNPTIKLSARSTELPPSSIRRIVLRAAELESEGQSLIRLDIGSLDVPVPDRIKAGVVEAMAVGQTGYSAAEGTASYRKAAAAHLMRRFAGSALSTGIDPGHVWQHVIGSQGGTQALNSLFYLLADAGGAVLLPEIGWPNYIQQAHLARVEQRFYKLDEHYHPDPQSILELSPGASAVVLNSPSNPTGAVTRPEVVRELHAIAVERGLWLVSDESYCDLVFEGEHLSALELDWALEEEARRVFAVFSCSKSYASPGLRLGYTVCPTDASARTLGLLNDPFLGCLTTPFEWAMQKGFELEDARERREALLPRWRRATETLHEHGLSFVKPGGGMFFFVDISASGLASGEFAMRLLAERQTAVVPGDGFGLHPLPDGRREVLARADRHVRLCFTAPEEKFNEGVRRLATFVGELRRW